MLGVCCIITCIHSIPIKTQIFFYKINSCMYTAFKFARAFLQMSVTRQHSWGTMLKFWRSQVLFPMSLDTLNLPNLSSRTIALVLTRPLTRTGTRNLPGGKERLPCRADNLTANTKPIVQTMWELRRPTTLWPSRACYKGWFDFTLLLFIPFSVRGLKAEEQSPLNIHPAGTIRSANS
jgi:hypothetical protein